MSYTKKIVFITALVFSCIFYSSCLKNEVISAKMFPSDYLFAQRSYPSGQIDQESYFEALKYQQRNKQMISKAFDKPWMAHGPVSYCGRITDLEMPPNDQNIIYAGSASGGIFKSEDRGASWLPIFDEAKSLSIGDLAIYQNDPKIIYAGTGESNAGGGSLAYDGVGVYKTEDAGVNWKELGPSKIGSIGKIAIDPNDSDRVYVAAMGSLFENNEERGVYRSKDGGTSWENVLMVSDSTGAIDLAIDPNNGDIVYAAMWERIRKPYGRKYGGATSGIYKTIDGGDSWVELTNGLPQNPSEKGRIGLAIAPSDANIIYAFYAAENGFITGIFKSEDAGMSWEQKSFEGIDNVPYIWWFGKIFVDPQDPDHLFATSLNLAESIDGGESWTRVFVNAHVDHHSVFIHPQNPALILNGNDGGVNLSIGLNPIISDYLNGINNFQFYTCEIDPVSPNIIYGGAQDNGTNRIKSDGSGWERIYGGDGFRVQIDPNDNARIYCESQYGNIVVSSNGGQGFLPANDGISGSSNWNTPLILDPLDSDVLYTGTDRLYKSTNQAENWTAVSNSLVNDNNPSGNITFGSLTTIDVSSLNNEIVYVGTDDGNVWVTTDNSASFTNISSGIPQRWITSITHDPWLESGVYLTVSGFRFAESDSQVFYSDDFGANWISIASNLPDIPVNDIIADDLFKEVLYLATDIGVFVSEDKGENWSPLGFELPNVPILDLDFDSQSRKLAAASFGRGIFSYELPLLSSIEDAAISPVAKIGPNPTDGLLNIFTEEEIHWIKLYDLNGRLVFHSFDEKNIDLSHLSSGMYSLVMSIADQRVQEKIIID